jgi:hypothetical protein
MDHVRSAVKAATAPTAMGALMNRIVSLRSPRIPRRPELRDHLRRTLSTTRSAGPAFAVCFSVEIVPAAGQESGVLLACDRLSDAEAHNHPPAAAPSLQQRRRTVDVGRPVSPTLASRVGGDGHRGCRRRVGLDILGHAGQLEEEAIFDQLVSSSLHRSDIVGVGPVWVAIALL